MSVFTTVTRADLDRFLPRYAVGTVSRLQGIEEGIENTNYFVDTTGAEGAGRFVLTLFERTETESLPYFLGVMAHLSAAGIPGAEPVPLRDGSLLTELCGRPAALVRRLPGRGVRHPGRAQSAAAAAELARLHLAGRDFPDRRPNCRAAAWWTPAAQRLAPLLKPAERALLESEISAQSQLDDDALPQGVIHADLFRDNALFDGDALSGFIDFYYACHDSWLYDLAVFVNDWVINTGAPLDRETYREVLAHYAAERPFVAAEHLLWNGKLRAAALRFWVSRLLDWHFPRPGELTYRKDPDEFRRLLQWHRENRLELPA